jgi:hypothetical protein
MRNGAAGDLGYSAPIVIGNNVYVGIGNHCDTITP